MHVNPARIRTIHPGKGVGGTGPVIYWMSRDQRLHDNWALAYAQEQAMQKKTGLIIVFCLVPSFLGATIRQYDFLLRGLEELEISAKEKGYGFQLLIGSPAEVLGSFLENMRASLLVRDVSPLRIYQDWRRHIVREAGDVPIVEVDAHNIVPVWHASTKREFGAYTLRPKLHRLLPEFLTEFPSLKKMDIHPPHLQKIDWEKARASLKIDQTISIVDWIEPGEKAAKQALRMFIDHRLSGYDEGRNDPNKDQQSNLSPYLHFGQISAQRIALEVQKSSAPKKDRDAFLEELVVRRELSDNFCYYTPNYDTVEAFADWAKQSIEEHRNDAREYLYTLKQFEKAQTHDALWNAAQRQMAMTGKMHGYMRMYWAEKILEWTPSAEEAMKIAIELNDRYELDGRDPNGYAGIAWSIGGTHDRAWFERPVFGKIRYMNANGARTKFDVNKYIQTWTGEAVPQTISQTKKRR